ncbi:MAG: hypothetical protein RMH75_07745, partial [Archaeoglobaceae archaeon]|nr:hypothetical protein [Archaeoglobaceae archaeon]
TTGGFNATFTVPNVAFGEHTVRAICMQGATGQAADGNFTVVPALISVAPSDLGISYFSINKTICRFGESIRIDIAGNGTILGDVVLVALNQTNFTATFGQGRPLKNSTVIDKATYNNSSLTGIFTDVFTPPSRSDVYRIVAYNVSAIDEFIDKYVVLANVTVEPSVVSANLYSGLANSLRIDWNLTV